MHYEIEITRAVQSQEEIEVFDHEIKQFSTKQEVKEFLQEEYFRYDERVKGYAEGKNGPVQIGWIYCTTVDDGSEARMQQDWVEVREMTGKPILVTV